MTIKNNNTNISAENEDIVKDIDLNSDGTLSITKKNLYNDQVNSQKSLNLKSIKLRILKKTQAQLNALADSDDPNDILLRETNVFLVPLDGDDTNDLDEYKEMVWSEEKEAFEQVGSTRIDLENLSSTYATKNELSSHNQSNDAHSNIRSALVNKVDKEQGKGLSTNDFTDLYKNDLQYILDKLGLKKESIDKFNFAVIKKTANSLTYEEFWILVNAEYDYENEKFLKKDNTHTSFGIQLQANGTYPGEEGIDNANTGINIWRNPSRAANESKDIGALVNNEWKTFGIAAGWINSIMYDSYGGITVGGAGIEVDGNGIFPFGRLTHSTYTYQNNDYYLFGLIDNAYHPTRYGDWGFDTSSQYSWFIGLKSPSESGLTKDTSETTFVVMYNDTPQSSSVLDKSKWHTVFEVGVDGLKTLNGLGNPISGNIIAEDFEITYNNGSNPEIVSILTLQNNNN